MIHNHVQIEHFVRMKQSIASTEMETVLFCFCDKLFGTRTHTCMSHGQLAYRVVEETMLL